MLLEREEMVADSEYKQGVVMLTSEFEILDGPTKKEFFASLEMAHQGRQVEFAVKFPVEKSPSHRKTISKTFEGRIKGICVGDVPGETWGFKISDGLASLGSVNLHGYYNTTTRKGRVRYE